MASRSLKLLLVAAHPADTFDQAGGTLAHHVAQGDHVDAHELDTAAGKLNAERRRKGAEPSKLDELLASL